MRWCVWAVCLSVSVQVCHAGGVDLTVQTPSGMQVKSAAAANVSMKLETAGTVTGQAVVFHDLLPDTPYDIRLALADGTVLQGVDMGWYNEEPAKPNAEPLSDDDREQVRAVLQDIKAFTNRNDILLLQGDHNRAVLLAQLIRDKDFHADKGGEIIWRIELWYFKNNYGGWEKISQVNKVLRRERYRDAAAFNSATENIKWVPELGGIVVAKGKPGTVTLKSTNDK